jgi:hypothetical protein
LQRRRRAKHPISRGSSRTSSTSENSSGDHRLPHGQSTVAAVFLLNVRGANIGASKPDWISRPINNGWRSPRYCRASRSVPTPHYGTSGRAGEQQRNHPAQTHMTGIATETPVPAAVRGTRHR